MNALLRLRHRLVVASVFLAAAASFALPFLTASVDQRTAEATGVELVTGNAALTGRYVHDSYRGEIERLVDDGKPFTAFAFGCALGGFALAWLRGRKASWVGVAFAGVGLLGMFAVWQATTPPFQPPDSDHRYGFWLGVLLFLLAGIGGVLRVRREPRRPAEPLRPKPPWAA